MAAVLEAASVVQRADGPEPARRVLYLMGAPGTGKTTQGGRLAERLGGVHVSAGELVRQAQERGEAVPRHPRKRQLVDPQWIVARVAAEARGAGLLLVDGFPRDPEHLEWASGLGEAAGAIRLWVDFETALDRMYDRGRTGEDVARIVHRRTFYEKHERAVLEALAARGLPVVAVDGRGAVEEVAERVGAAACGLLG